MERLSGIVERITFSNEENGFRVTKIRSQGFPDLVTVVGNMASVNVGSVINLQGEWHHDSKYGKQFKVAHYSESIPASVTGIEKYLGSGLIKGIGPVNARRIVKQFQEDTILVIEEDPEQLIKVEGIGPKRVEIIKQAWEEQKEIKNVMLFLQDQGVSTAYAVKIYKTYGNDSIKLVRENPYRLADDIWGIGFKTADRIAGRLGYDANSYERCRSGLIYSLNQLANEGHCYVKLEVLIREGISLLEIEEDSLKKTIKVMIEEKTIISEEGDILYLPPFYYSEVGTAQKIREIINTPSLYNSENIEQVLDEVQRDAGIVYDQVQKEAVRTAAAAKFMVLTGGPGTGKTTTTLAIIKAFEKMHARILLAAPTGRAAKRMTEATGVEAKTIHRLLEYKPPDGYLKNTDNLLECDVLIVDESSMVDIILMYNLLKAVALSSIVILVGDVDQLPSVGAGNVLRDIINSGRVQVVKLVRIFRQAQDSLIVTNAHRINKGQFPVLKGSAANDFFFLAGGEPEQVLEEIQNLCASRLPAYYHVDPINDIQVLSPMVRGEMGTRRLNEVLQERLNKSETFILYGGIKYKLHDKVMQIKNNYDKNVFNGDVGRITRIDLEDKIISISFEGHDVEYDITELDEVMLAYATTIHKSQGSEYGIVVAPLVTQHYMMLQRNLLYTCITRARKAIVLVGSKKALAIAIKNNKVEERNTLLAQRLSEV